MKFTYFKAIVPSDHLPSWSQVHTNWINTTQHSWHYISERISTFDCSTAAHNKHDTGQKIYVYYVCYHAYLGITTPYLILNLWCSALYPIVELACKSSLCSKAKILHYALHYTKPLQFERTNLPWYTNEHTVNCCNSLFFAIRAVAKPSSATRTNRAKPPKSRESGGKNIPEQNSDE